MAVTKLEINSRSPFAQGQPFGDTGGYEQIDGTVYFAVDPGHPANEPIADLKLATRDASGMVTFSSDFRILQPTDPSKGNRSVFFDILNRGKAPALRNFNNAPEVAPDAPMDPGNGFLMRYGYTVVWCGWQCDVPDLPGVMRINVPDAVTAEGPISGEVVVTFHPNTPTQVQYLSDRSHRPYPANKLEDWDSVLTVQEHEDAPEEIIPREQWAFARIEDGRVTPDARHIYMAAGFVPGKVYQVKYTTTGAPIVGLGLLATRDLMSFLRHGSSEQDNPCAGYVDRAHSFGVSQSGRFLRHFLYLGMNEDESGRTVFDGLIPHVGGGKRGEFNHRFAQPSSQASRSPNSLFPFSDTDQTDPETGRTDGLMRRLAAKGKVPKVMYINTPSEYWGGHGSLLHTDLTGTRDLDLLDSVRIYMVGGAQHANGSLPLTDFDPGDDIRTQQLFNCLDYRAVLRAALVNLDRWAKTGHEAPPSRYPRLSDGTAVTPGDASASFRAIPGVNPPVPLRRFTRLDFGPDPGVPTNVPPVVGNPYPSLVSAVDSDGNELAGIRLPFITVPVAAYTGWNVRHPDIGGAGQTMSTGGATGGTLRGSTIPFAVTREDREATGDPRLSIEERYASKEDYLEQVRQAAQDLVDQGYVLGEDLPRLVDQCSQLYDAVASRVSVPQAAND